MAGLAASKQELDLAEICYSELELFDKVLFIKNIKVSATSTCQDLGHAIRDELNDSILLPSVQNNSQDEPTRKANLAILCGNIADAENILMQNKKIAELIQLFVYGCEWEK